MVKRIATAMVAAAMGATALGAATPAFANPGRGPEPKIASIEAGPNPVVIKKHGSAQVTIKVGTVDVKDVKVSIEPTNQGRGLSWEGGGNPFSSLRKDDPAANYTKPVWKTFDRSFTIDWKHPDGSWKVRVLALGFDGKEYSRDGSFFVKHVQADAPKGPKGTRIVGFDATPEPVRQGRKLVLRGKLEVAQCYGEWHYEWDGYDRTHGGDDNCRDSRKYWNDWHWLGDQDIDVYFMPKGSSEWRRVGTVETDDDGNFATRVRAFRSGTWGVKFDGTNRLRGSEASDYVKVIRY